jgi:hypothetical protein
MKGTHYLRAVILVGLLAWATPAQAEMVDFSYTWSVNQQTFGDPSSVLITFSSASVSGSASALLGSPEVPGLLHLQATSTVPTAGSASIDAPLQFSLLVTDTESGQSGTMTLAARLHGEIDPMFNGIRLEPTEHMLKSVQLGRHVYWLGGIIDIQPAWVNPPFSTTPTPLVRVTSLQAPEPSALTLAGAGALGLAAWGRLRRRAQPV